MNIYFVRSRSFKIICDTFHARASRCGLRGQYSPLSIQITKEGSWYSIESTHLSRPSLKGPFVLLCYCCFPFYHAEREYARRKEESTRHRTLIAQLCVTQIWKWFVSALKLGRKEAIPPRQALTHSCKIRRKYVTVCRVCSLYNGRPYPLHGWTHSEISIFPQSKK